MERAGDFHDSILSANDAEPTNIFHGATAFDTAVDMFNAHADGRKLLIEGFLVWGQLAASWFFERGQTDDLIERKGKKA